MNLGRGTALRLISPEMLDLRERLAARFHGLLTPQDEHAPRLHVTIQSRADRNARIPLRRPRPAPLFRGPVGAGQTVELSRLTGTRPAPKCAPLSPRRRGCPMGRSSSAG